MSILVTSIGSMSAPFVIDTIKKMGHSVVGIDIYPKTWVASSVDTDFFYQVAYTSDASLYLKQILYICKKHHIKLIIPLTDVDVDFYADYIDLFCKKGIIITISDKKTIRIVRNKQLIFSTFKNTSLAVIPTFNNKSYVEKFNIFPAVGKKVKGRSSEGLMFFEDATEIKLKKFQSDDYIFQPYIAGDIIVVDILNCPVQNKLIYIARKELTRTKNGAGITVEITENVEIEKYIKVLCEIVEIRGCINIEFIKTPDSKYYLMDINPRPSAGVIFSNYAGYNFIQNHINTFLNLPIARLIHIKNNLVITRKYSEVII